MKRRASGCWLIGCSSLLIAAALTALGLILPPIDLPDRLQARSYSAAQRRLALLTYESDLRLAVSADDATSDFALKIIRLSQAEFRADSPDHPDWLPAARDALPSEYTLQSALFLLDARGSPPAALRIELRHSAESERVAFRGWDGDDWRYIPTAQSGDRSVGTADFAPLAFGLFDRLPPAPIVLIAQAVDHDLNEAALGVTNILSPAGLRPNEQGGLVGALAPGGDSDSAYQFMPLIQQLPRSASARHKRGQFDPGQPGPAKAAHRTDSPAGERQPIRWRLT